MGAVTAVTTGTASAGALSGAATASMFAGPIGLAILGADGYTWDCWKPVVMDDSVGLSRGIALRDLYNHPNLRRIRRRRRRLRRGERPRRAVPSLPGQRRRRSRLFTRPRSNLLSSTVRSSCLRIRSGLLIRLGSERILCAQKLETGCASECRQRKQQEEALDCLGYQKRQPFRSQFCQQHWRRRIDCKLSRRKVEEKPDEQVDWHEA